MYTDETNAMLALAHSLVVNEGLEPKHAAQSYAEFWSTEIKRGYPESVQASMQVSIMSSIDSPRSRSIVLSMTVEAENFKRKANLLLTKVLEKKKFKRTSKKLD